jgi:hypothetical protein
LRLALVCVEVPTKDSGGSLGPPLSYRAYRKAGLSAVGRLPAARLLLRVGSAVALGLLQLAFAMVIVSKGVQ